MKRVCIYIILSLLLSLLSVEGFSQKRLVKGKVLNDLDEPLEYVTVLENGYEVARSDEDGNFTVMLLPNTDLVFFKYGYDTLHVNTAMKQLLRITMPVPVVEIDEAVLVAQKVKQGASLKVHPTAIEVRSNYLIVKTKFEVPWRIFNKNTRLLVQPGIKDVISKQMVYMKPLVVDGSNYACLQDRLSGFNYESTPVYPYVKNKDITKRDNIVSYKDSIRFITNSNNYLCYIVLSIENSNRELFKDSIVIARGTVNPLRFFEYNLEAKIIDDSKYIPEPDMNLFEDRGSLSVQFRINSAQINEKDPESLLSIKKIVDKLNVLEKDTLSTLKRIQIDGVASPEGNLKTNSKLAAARSKFILEKVSSEINPEYLKYIDVKYTSRVAKWEEILPLMESDNSPYLEDFVSLLNKYPERDYRFVRALKSRKYYRSVMVNNYLPRLRRTDYQIEYTKFRTMTLAEVKTTRTKYQKDSLEDISRYNYYQLLEEPLNDTISKESLLKESLEHYPKFLLAAIRLSKIQFARHDYDTSVFQSFVNPDLEDAILYNQTLAFLNKFSLEKAVQTFEFVKQKENYQYLTAIIDVLTGDYAAAYPYLDMMGPFNQVLIYLAMNKNKEALELIKQIDKGDNARILYVLAICENRLGNLNNALNALRQAVELDPSLREVLKVDADLLDLINIL